MLQLCMADYLRNKSSTSRAAQSETGEGYRYPAMCGHRALPRQRQRFLSPVRVANAPIGFEPFSKACTANYCGFTERERKTNVKIRLERHLRTAVWIMTLL